tara:strand:- start:6971 stop:8092 length:1122 start_codon:yes stop_codon:yes gene_type:complete
MYIAVKNITFVYSGNRKKLLSGKEKYARDFFYGYTEFDQKKYNLNIIEFEKPNCWLASFFTKFDSNLSKLLSLPIYFSKILNKKNFKTLLGSNEIYLVNEGVGISTLPFLIIINLFKSNSINLFVMGLYSKNIRYSFFYPLHKLFIRLLVSQVDYLVFLGEGELKKAKKFHRNNTHKKFIFSPFLIDSEFWSINGFNLKNNKNILFVGNDGNRDFKFLIELVTSLSDFSFTIVSSDASLKELDLKNVKLIDGDWAANKLSDEDLRKVYASSKLCIIPLKRSTQPSGQSVALQSMSMGVPVMITDTEGFWDHKSFNDNQELFLIKENSLELWASKIRLVFSDEIKLDLVSKNARELINKKFSINDNLNYLKNIN